MQKSFQQSSFNCNFNTSKQFSHCISHVSKIQRLNKKKREKNYKLLGSVFNCMSTFQCKQGKQIFCIKNLSVWNKLYLYAHNPHYTLLGTEMLWCCCCVNEVIEPVKCGGCEQIRTVETMKMKRDFYKMFSPSKADIINIKII